MTGERRIQTKQFERLLEQMVIRTRWLLVPISPWAWGAVIPLLVVKYFQQVLPASCWRDPSRDGGELHRRGARLDSALLASLVVMVLITPATRAACRSSRSARTRRS